MENEENGRLCDVFEDLYNAFLDKLEAEANDIYHSISDQIEFRDQLYKVADAMKKRKEKTEKKSEILRKEISKGGTFDMVQFDNPKPIPLDPKILVRGVEPQKCFLFKSAMLPLKLSFYAQTSDPES